MSDKRFGWKSLRELTACLVTSKTIYHDAVGNCPTLTMCFNPAVISGILGFVGGLALVTVNASEEKVHCLAINSAVENQTRANSPA